MFITRIANNNAYDIDIKNEKFLSLFKQKVDNNNLFWKKGSSFKSKQDVVISTYLGYVLNQGSKIPLPNQVYSFNLSFSFFYDSNKINILKVDIDLYLNIKNNPSGQGEQEIASWIFANERGINTLLKPFVRTEFNIDMDMFPHEEDIDKKRQIELRERGSVIKHMFGKNVVDGIRLTRNKSLDYGDAKSIEIYVENIPSSFQTEKIFKTAFKITNLEKQMCGEETVKFTGTLEQALDQYDEVVERARKNNYVDETSTLESYIPEGANSSNYDFVLRKFKEDMVNQDASQDSVNIINNTEDILDDVFGSSSNIVVKTAQDFGGYYAGNIPDYAVSNLGTSSVDASQVSSMFGKTNDAIKLVNQFNSSLLKNVSFIFNFSKSGAYGVYLSELDRAIKTKALQKKLEANGYRVEPNDKGMLMAYPTREDKTSEEIQKDINRLYADLESMGGTAFGINMNSVLNSAKMDAAETQSKDPNIWEWMALLHLGATIVHEAVHAMGNHEEGPSESAEASFINWALPKINEQYMQSLNAQGKSELFAPIMIGSGTRMARGKTWYKKAQMNNYIPQSIIGKPRGSDLSGRAGTYTPEEGMADWGLLSQQDQNIPLESRLGRDYMSPLPSDLDQEHDSYEEQLRKYTRHDQKINSNETMEELLSVDYDTDNMSYRTIEELLEERRPKPLIIPLKKAASTRLIKKATLFGWMNNLEISDGSTIPGLSDRVMAWEDSEGDFAWTEKDIRSQPRYNPTYDIKGFYYRWIDPRLKPQLYDDMTRDYSGTHPAKRFASKEEDASFVKVLNIISIAKKMILNGNIQATRLIMSEDMLPVVASTVNDVPDIKTMACHIGKDKVVGDETYAVWLYCKEIDSIKIKTAEDIFSKGGKMDEDLLEELFRIESQRKQTIDIIIKNVQKICKEYDITDIYTVGGYPRVVMMHEPMTTVEDLDFSGACSSQSIKVGGLLAEKLGAKDVNIYHKTMTLSFIYRGIKVDFKGNFSPMEIKKQMTEEGIPTTPLNMDVYNRDFTINMLVYDVDKDEVYDVCGESVEDLHSKILRTYFDPEYICRQNPLIIIRALKFKMRGYKIDPELEKAMICTAPLLFDGRYSKERLLLARESIEAGDKDLADELFKEYGLIKIKEI